VQYADGYTLQFGGGEPAALRQRLEDLRGSVPPGRRRWDPATRTWWVDPALENTLRVLSRWADRWFAPGQVERERVADTCAGAWAGKMGNGDAAAEGWLAAAQEARAAYAPAGPRAAGGGGWGAGTVNWRQAPVRTVPQDPLADAYAALWLRPGAPTHVVKAAYRALAAVHHPDVGGDEAAMRRLNAAYAALQRQAG
jgi:hypothetical protein